MEQASKATEAKVATALTERAITSIFLEQRRRLTSDRVRNRGRSDTSQEYWSSVAKSAHNPHFARKNPQWLSNDESVRGICRMVRPGKRAAWGLAMACLAVLAGVSAWIGHGVSGSRAARDYEDCAAEAQANATSSAEYSRLITHCGERFAGRRKPGGGYTYFDFLQNRTFDIAGPNPTDHERKLIDWSYLEFLGAQRRDALLSELAKAQANEEQAVFRRGRQASEAPLSLTPKIPLPMKRPTAERSKSCEDGSLSCSWAKLSAAVRNALASSAGTSK
jgi:hypothetical protein